MKRITFSLFVFVFVIVIFKNCFVKIITFSMELTQTETGSEDDGLLDMSEDDFFLSGSSSDEADADDEWTDKSTRYVGLKFPSILVLKNGGKPTSSFKRCKGLGNIECLLLYSMLWQGTGFQCFWQSSIGHV